MRKSNIIFVALLMGIAAVGTTAQELEEPIEGKAKVYIFNFGGRGVGQPARIFLDKTYMGTSTSSRYLGIDVEPGRHLIWTFSVGKRWFSSIDVQEGKTYYLQLVMTPGGFNPVPAPVLYNSCKNSKIKNASKRYKSIEERLQNDRFSPLDPAMQETALDFTEIIEGNMEKWESEWKRSNRWKYATILPADGF